MTSGRAPTQSSSQQTTRVALEDQQGVIHVLVVAAVEEAQLLLSVGRIVGGIDIEQDLSSFPNLFPADLHKPIEQSILHMQEVTRRGRVLPTAEGGLGSQRCTQRLIGQNLKRRIVAKPIRVVGVLVARDDLVQALAKQ